MHMTVDYTLLVAPEKLSANESASGKRPRRLQPLHRDHQSRACRPPRHQTLWKLPPPIKVNPSHPLKTKPLLRAYLFLQYWLGFASRPLSLFSYMYTASTGYRCLDRRPATVISVLEEDLCISPIILRSSVYSDILRYYHHGPKMSGGFPSILYSNS